MALKNIAIASANAQIDESSAGTGKASITSLGSNVVQIDGQNVLIGSISIFVSGYSGTGFTNGSGTGTLNGSSIKTKIENQSVVLEGDKATFTVIATTTSTPASQISVPVTVKIASAGQSGVKAE